MKKQQANVRSTISNTAHVLEGVDGRSGPGRRFRDLLHSIAADLGGIDALTIADLSMVRQAAALMLRADQLQAAVVRGDSDADELSRVADQTRRVLADLHGSVSAREMKVA